MNQKEPSYNIIDKTIYIMFGNEPFQAELTPKLQDSINNKDWNSVYAQVSKKESKAFGNILDRVGIVDGKLAGRPVPESVLDRIKFYLENNVPYSNFMRMLDNLLNIPYESKEQREKKIVDVVNFLSAHVDFALTSDGAILAYKKVQNDLSSYMTNDRGEHLHYQIGTFVSLPESEVDSDSGRPCSKGIHACARSYLPSFYGDQGKVLILKIYPQDIRAVPTDYGCAKLRCVRTFVVDYADSETMKMAFATGVYYEDREQMDSDVDEDYDEDWDEWDDYSEEWDNDEVEDFDAPESELVIDNRATLLDQKILERIEQYWQDAVDSDDLENVDNYTYFRRIAKNLGVNYAHIRNALKYSNFTLHSDSDSLGQWYVTLS
jgi:hypothetical protein